MDMFEELKKLEKIQCMRSKKVYQLVAVNSATGGPIATVKCVSLDVL